MRTFIHSAATACAIALLCTGCLFEPSALEDLQCESDADCPDGRICEAGFCNVGEAPEPDPIEPDPNPEPTNPDPNPSMQVNCVDRDMDGAQNAALSRNCDLPIDCEDGDDKRAPGLPEICDGIDNDCNEDIDDIPVESLPLCELQEGVCSGKRQQCINGIQTTECGPEQYGPSFIAEEAFCLNGRDAKGRCVGGAVFGINAEAEANLCDGLDNDCDGDVDEPEVDIPCFNNISGEAVSDDPILERAQNFCLAGVLQCLTNPNTLENPDYDTLCTEGQNPELNDIPCDNLDQDCNGELPPCECETIGETQDCYPGDQDEGLVGTGTCAFGVETCNDDFVFGPCENPVIPEAETCANQNEDNDCNGTVDDIGDTTLNETCDNLDLAGTACEAGTYVCEGNNAEDAVICEPIIAVGTQPETCNDIGIDNDCDLIFDDVDTPDNNDNNDPLGNVACSVPEALGECVAGTYECPGGNIPQPICVSDNEPALNDGECNGLDEDCDGIADEDNPKTDNANCGDCDIVCPQGTDCCFDAALRPEAGCVDFQTNSQFCGNCATDCNGAPCVDGVCDEGG